MIILGGTGNIFLLGEVGDLGDRNCFLVPAPFTAEPKA